MTTEQEFYDNLFLDKSGIYYNNIIQGRIDALIDIFPATTACLSEAFIRFIAHDFCINHDAPFGNLNLYGQSFPQYLASLSVCKNYPFLYELATFEYEIRKLFYLSDQKRLDRNQIINAINTKQNIFLSDDCLGLITEYPVVKIVDFCLGKTDMMPELIKGEYCFFLYRNHLTQEIFIYELNKADVEIIPILKFNGLDFLSQQINYNNGYDYHNFIQFLTEQQLWHIKGCF